MAPGLGHGHPGRPLNVKLDPRCGVCKNRGLDSNSRLHMAITTRSSADAHGLSQWCIDYDEDHGDVFPVVEPYATQSDRRLQPTAAAAIMRGRG